MSKKRNTAKKKARFKKICERVGAIVIVLIALSLLLLIITLLGRTLETIIYRIAEIMIILAGEHPTCTLLP